MPLRILAAHPIIRDLMLHRPLHEHVCARHDGPPTPFQLTDKAA
jgi:hypothetical protein